MTVYQRGFSHIVAILIIFVLITSGGAYMLVQSRSESKAGKKTTQESSGTDKTEPRPKTESDPESEPKPEQPAATTPAPPNTSAQTRKSVPFDQNIYHLSLQTVFNKCITGDINATGEWPGANPVDGMWNDYTGDGYDDIIVYAALDNTSIYTGCAYELRDGILTEFWAMDESEQLPNSSFSGGAGPDGKWVTYSGGTPPYGPTQVIHYYKYDITIGTFVRAN